MKYTNLFIRQSYLDSCAEYQKSISRDNYATWDYVILTASNESQADSYRAQLDYRQKAGCLPAQTKFLVLSDPDGRRVGSGGATLNVLRHIALNDTRKFDELKLLVIHSGGDSKRVPQYSACGKLFSPVPRILPDGRRSTLFDEFLITFTGVSARIPAGMMVASGDVLLLFNPLQIDFYGTGAAALSIKENVETGQHHGVFLKDASGNVGRFLHKQSTETLDALGAVDTRRNVDIDTGAVFFDYNILNELYDLIKTEEGFNAYVNETCRLSFYADFLFPLASEATLEDYLLETPEGEFSDALTACRKELWKRLHPFKMKLLQFAPAAFIHFGTSGELRDLLTKRLDDFLFLDWKSAIASNQTPARYAVSGSYISEQAFIAEGCYIEDSYIGDHVTINRDCIVSGVTLADAVVPKGLALHGLKLSDGNFVARLYSVDDNPKEGLLFGHLELPGTLWDTPLYPVCGSMTEACKATLSLLTPYMDETTSAAVLLDDIQKQREDGVTILSLHESFVLADTSQILPWQDKLNDLISVDKLISAAADRVTLSEAHSIFPFGLSDRAATLLEKRARKFNLSNEQEFSTLLRLYYFMSDFYKGSEGDRYRDLCFHALSDAILDKACEGITYNPSLTIARDEVITYLPVRVNFGGGWSDTPPYCLEHGGAVLNASITLNGGEPIEASIHKIPEYKIILSSGDNGSYKEFTDLAALQDCRDPFDAFALHKAALLSCGVIPMQGNLPLRDILKRLGGGIHLSTQVHGIPRGSGLGTSSILAAACVKGLYRFFGLEENYDGSPTAYENELFNRVLCMEQIMSTGGGWQDQVGGLIPGIKFITSEKGLKQELKVETLRLDAATLSELNERFCIIYTGQRRLARNLLREIVGKYIASDADILFVLERIKVLAADMKNALLSGNIDDFASIMNEHWEMSKRLDAGCTNTCIDQMFVACEDLIDGRMICGAGGGGFIQVILKKGVDKEELKQRLDIIFDESGVQVWDCNI